MNIELPGLTALASFASVQALDPTPRRCGALDRFSQTLGNTSWQGGTPWNHHRPNRIT